MTAATPALQTAYVQLAGFTAGRFLGTYYTAWDTDIGSYTTSSFTGRDTSQSAGVEYRAQFGNGISPLSVPSLRSVGSIYDRSRHVAVGRAFTTSGGLPVRQQCLPYARHQADVRVEQAWGGVHFGALLHENNVLYNGTNTPSAGLRNHGRSEDRVRLLLHRIVAVEAAGRPALATAS